MAPTSAFGLLALAPSEDVAGYRMTVAEARALPGQLFSRMFDYACLDDVPVVAARPDRTRHLRRHPGGRGRVHLAPPAAGSGQAQARRKGRRQGDPKGVEEGPQEGRLRARPQDPEGSGGRPPAAGTGSSARFGRQAPTRPASRSCWRPRARRTAPSVRRPGRWNGSSRCRPAMCRRCSSSRTASAHGRTARKAYGGRRGRAKIW